MIRLASCSFWSGLIVIADNTQSGYVAEGTRLKTALNRRGYSVVRRSSSYLYLSKNRDVRSSSS